MPTSEERGQAERPSVRRDGDLLAADSAQGVEILLVRVGQGVEVLLRGLNLGVAHSIHDRLEVGTAGEKPRRVSVAEIMDANGEVDT